MRIAIIGIRGIPAKYGGLETCAEEVGARLVDRGHEVFCYCRKGTEDDTLETYRGIRRIVLPTLRHSFTDTYCHTFLSFLHALRLKPDVFLAFNPGIGTLCILPRLFGYGIALNPDGFDWRRPKWNRFARKFIYFSAYCAAKVCDRLIIDAKSVADYYAANFHCDPIHIPNGANIDGGRQRRPDILARYGLKENEYFLFLSRHVPDNSCELILEAYRGLDTDKVLFFGGGDPNDSEYAQALRRYEDSRIRFPGPIYDPDEVRELHHGCYALIHGNQPGGTSLGLLKALGYGTCVLTLNTPDNAYVVKDAGITYELSVEDLRNKMRYVLDHPEVVQELRRKAIERIREEYLWDVVVTHYEEVLRDIARKHGRNV